jgi:ATP-binding cassette subfamily B protein
LRYLYPCGGQAVQLLFTLFLAMVLSLLDPLIVRYLIDDVLLGGMPGTLNLLMMALLALAIFGGAFGVLSSYLYTFVSQRILFDIRNELFRHLERQPLSFYAARKGGEILSRINNDVGALQELASGVVVSAVMDLLTVFGVLFILLLLNWKLCLIGVAAVPLFIAVVNLFSRRVREQSRAVREKVADITAFFQEILPAMGLVQSYGREAHEADRLETKGREMIALRLRVTLLVTGSSALIALVGTLGPLLVLWSGGHGVLRGTLSLGTLIAFYAYLGRLLTPVYRLAQVNVQIQSSLASVDRIFEYLDIVPEIADRPRARELREAPGGITFRDVWFAYEPGRPVLQGLQLEIAPGEAVALMGPSGAGKSTLVSLLCRFYDPQRGEIRIDGRELRDLTLASLRRAIALVSQDAIIFHASIRDNLRYAREGAGETEIVTAARAARLHEFVMSLPDGYDTVVGDRGVRLSGGERQRVAIARAILKDARIIVFDEALSMVDSALERSIQGELRSFLGGRTTLMIAHRPSVARCADRIVVLNGGRIEAAGTHEELSAECALYGQLANLAPLAAGATA